MTKLTLLKNKAYKSTIAIAVMATIVSTSAYAMRDRAYDIVYYSDAGKTEEVGRKSFPCDYGSSMEGTTSPYQSTEVTNDNCNGGMPVWPQNPLDPNPWYWP